VLSKKDIHGLWILAGVGVALAALFAVKLGLDAKPRVGSDNCVGPIMANTVVLLDHSEQITEQTRAEVA